MFNVQGLIDRYSLHPWINSHFWRGWDCKIFTWDWFNRWWL